MEAFETVVLERLQFFDGQRLFASDLQALETFNRQMRWRHNQSLHQVGIGNGFAVTGQKGDREVEIGPGYAVDVEGREIILGENHIEPVPPVAGEDDGSPVFYYLTVAYSDKDQDLEEVEVREGICLPRGVVRRREEPVFCWVRLKRVEDSLRIKNAALGKDISRGLKIVLATAEILNCQLEQPLDLSQRRNAKPPRQPYIACGAVKSVSWQLCDPTGNQCEDSKQLGNISIENATVLPFILTAEISTKAANFATTPCYTAHIVGPRIKQVENINVIVDGIINIKCQSASPRNFTVHVLLWIQSLQSTAANILTISKDLFSDWEVTWMGVEG